MFLMIKSSMLSKVMKTEATLLSSASLKLPGVLKRGDAFKTMDLKTELSLILTEFSTS